MMKLMSPGHIKQARNQTRWPGVESAAAALPASLSTLALFFLACASRRL